MIFLYITVLFLNSHTGFLLFRTYSRTCKHLFYKLNFLLVPSLISLHFKFVCSTPALLLILYTPLFIGMFPLLLLSITKSRRRATNYKTSITLLGCMDIHLQMGRSFTNSLGLALAKLPPRSDLNIFFQKNVVLQQPKSRNCTIFDELEQNLDTLSQQSLGKRELLGFIKYKFELNSELEQKIQLSSTQYKTQSYALIIFWLLAFFNLVIQKSVSIYIDIIALSFLLMFAGLFLAKKILVKTQFRI